jgi:hypothetical protein
VRRDEDQRTQRRGNDTCDFIHSPVLAGRLPARSPRVSCMVQKTCRTPLLKKPHRSVGAKFSPSSPG